MIDVSMLCGVGVRYMAFSEILVVQVRRYRWGAVRDCVRRLGGGWTARRPDLLRTGEADEIFWHVLSRSDGAGGLGEDRREPMPWVDIPAEFVVPVWRFWTNACPAAITRAERSRVRPRIGRS